MYVMIRFLLQVFVSEFINTALVILFSTGRLNQLADEGFSHQVVRRTCHSVVFPPLTLRIVDDLLSYKTIHSLYKKVYTSVGQDIIYAVVYLGTIPHILRLIRLGLCYDGHYCCVVDAPPVYYSVPRSTIFRT